MKIFENEGCRCLCVFEILLLFAIDSLGSGAPNTAGSGLDTTKGYIDGQIISDGNFSVALKQLRIGVDLFICSRSGGKKTGVAQLIY